MSTSRIDFLEALAKRGRACSNSKASRKADGMNTHQVRTETTNEANPKKRRWDSSIALYGPALVHRRTWFSALRIASSGAHTDQIKLSTEIA